MALKKIALKSILGLGALSLMISISPAQSVDCPEVSPEQYARYLKGELSSFTDQNNVVWHIRNIKSYVGKTLPTSETASIVSKMQENRRRCSYFIEGKVGTEKRKILGDFVLVDEKEFSRQ